MIAFQLYKTSGLGLNLREFHDEDKNYLKVVFIKHYFVLKIASASAKDVDTIYMLSFCRWI